MSVFSGPEIVNDNCVYHHDMGNTQKSWKGAPTTNLATTQTLVNHSLVTLPTFSDAPERGEGWKKAIVTATSTNFRMLKMDVFNVAANSTTTYSIEFECSNPEVYLNIDGTGFGGGAWTKIGDTRYSRTVTTATAGAAYLFVNSNNLSASVNYVIYYKEHQIESGSFATPYVASARSTTQAIVDLTNTNTVTATSLTYNSNNTFSFNGTSNSISMGNVLPINTAGQQITIDVWIFATRASGYIIGRAANNANYGHYSLALNGLTPQFGIYSSVAAIPAQYFLSGINIILNTWNHICISHIAGNSASTKFTINDVSTGSWTTGAGTAVSDQTNTALEVGHWFGTPTATSNAYWFQGDISLVKLYNRVLSTTEIKQNFNALRGRYGL